MFDSCRMLAWRYSYRCQCSFPAWRSIAAWLIKFASVVVWALSCIMAAFLVLQFRAREAWPLELTIIPGLPINGSLLAATNMTNDTAQAAASFTYPTWLNHTVSNSTHLPHTNGTNGSSIALTNSTIDHASIKLSVTHRKLEMSINGTKSVWQDGSWPYMNSTFIDGLFLGLNLTNATKDAFIEKLHKAKAHSFKGFLITRLGFPCALAVVSFGLFMTFAMMHHHRDWKDKLPTTFHPFRRCGKVHEVYKYVFFVAFSGVLIVVGWAIGLLAFSVFTVHDFDKILKTLEPEVKSASVNKTCLLMLTYWITTALSVPFLITVAILTWRYNHNMHEHVSQRPKSSFMQDHLDQIGAGALRPEMAQRSAATPAAFSPYISATTPQPGTPVTTPFGAQVQTPGTASRRMSESFSRPRRSMSSGPSTVNSSFENLPPPTQPHDTIGGAV